MPLIARANEPVFIDKLGSDSTPHRTRIRPEHPAVRAFHARIAALSCCQKPGADSTRKNSFLNANKSGDPAAVHTLRTVTSLPTTPTPSVRPDVLPPCRGDDPVRDVFVVLASKKTPVQRCPDAAIRVFRPPPIFLIGIAILLVLTVGNALARVFGVNAAYGLAFMGVLTVPVFIHYVIRARIPKAPKDAPVHPAEDSGERPRLLLVANRDQANAVGPLRDDPFEPVVTPVLFALRGKKHATVIVWIAASVLAMLVLWYVKKNTTVFSDRTLQAWEAWACFGFAAAPLAFLWPTYLRVSPGRLDVLSFGLLGSGKPAIRTFDLRAHSVLLNLVGRQLRLKDASGAECLVDLGSWTPRPLELARAVFEAARWKHDVSELPDDELVG
ncbi:hypothetical protein PHYC_02564 [Phycisphaerales bacterium]|nr:hypothetical protein PHYC_02564 [Phycisphaerales bacterium]